MSNPFFKCHGPLNVSEIVKALKINIDIKNIDHKIHDVKDLNTSNERDITAESMASHFHGLRRFKHSQRTKDLS